MNWNVLPLIIAVCLLLNFVLDCIEESVKHYEWRDDE